MLQCKFKNKSYQALNKVHQNTAFYTTLSVCLSFFTVYIDITYYVTLLQKMGMSMIASKHWLKPTLNIRFQLFKSLWYEPVKMICKDYQGIV